MRRRFVLHHTFAKDDELDITYDRHAAPCDGRGPERGMVGYSPRHGGEMGVSGWEEVEGDVWGEDLLREWGGEEGRKT